ncbi:hypothetical protein HKX54_01110 [Sulfitobacter sp. M57]|uniref:hypothetical protein n=1 Tax=unclassified Sulfitobacter TaxID=196795 RepID=UPI0023E0D11F|nr:MULTISPECIES: hypothetical protein [unclassified Sulfitobacter]MDF3413042.1 hypothetical protein [Sulfitobacter sp. KE5]MDF3421674.1 hypothetical protein [Sulfitobacter sp. KE43]MDF3431591.1 hypothetical protein [Sulfitobacter sp. KE42]MDF3457232.1 hypothetical protein [Sulfitobacter sp. S74]MDF3461135.1 hypothetical protein [Sulfitobacter sp. Ks18]
MSDPVTNAEVEDVLSSIRRLVSEDNRPVQISKVDSNGASSGRHVDSARPQPMTDRLVLTPALRVSESPEEEPVSETARKADSGSGASIDDLVTDDMPLDIFAPRVLPQEQSQQDDAGTELFDDVTADGALDDPAQDYSTDPYHFDDDADPDGDGTTTHIDFGGSQDHRADEPQDQDAVLHLSPTAAFNKTSLAGQGDAPQHAAHEQLASDVAQDDTADTASIRSEPLALDPSMSSDKSVALTAKIAALETAIGQISDTWEPDDAGDGDYAGSEAAAMQWEDDPAASKAADEPVAAPEAAALEPADPELEAEEQGETLEVMEAQLEEFFAKSETAKRTEEPASPAPETSATEETAAEDTTPPEADSFAYSAEEQLIDEEALRDLVSEIVRAELQGALGERITRNVRKLVRREIHRALAAQELE